MADGGIEVKVMFAPTVDDWFAQLLAMGERIEKKLDTLITALATEEEDDGTVRSLDGGLFAPRDEKKGLG